MPAYASFIGMYRLLRPRFDTRIGPALAYYVEGARVLDLIDDRETHIVGMIRGHSVTGAMIPRFVLWRDKSIHKVTGTGITRKANQIILL